MKRLIGLLAIAAAAVLVAGGMNAAGSDKKTDRTTTTLQLVARVTSFNLVDNPPTEKASGGDMSARTGDLFTPSRKRAGRDQVFCVAVNATGTRSASRRPSWREGKSPPRSPSTPTPAPGRGPSPEAQGRTRRRAAP